MKQLLTIALLLISAYSFSQSAADSGKAEFKKQAQSNDPDYSTAYRILSNQVKQNPTNAELRYFLGYTIDRLNAKFGDSMHRMGKELAIKASEQFEEVNRLQPIYKGELFLLDPYSKITSTWGCLAESYLNKNYLDSAKWAFSEGKRRGGFNEAILEYNRQLVNSCPKNSILITSGDAITISLWYLQTMENLRNDVTIVDASLIHSIWYPKYLKAYRNLKLSFSDAQIDTLNYIEWTSRKIEIVNPDNASQKLSWQLPPTYEDGYILKGDRIMLDMFQQNFFKRPIYFCIFSDSTNNLFLSPYLVDEGLVERVDYKRNDSKKPGTATLNNLNTYNIQNIKKEDIIKSRDAIQLLNNYRWAYYASTSNLMEQKNNDKARELITQMAGKFSKSKLPYIGDYESYYNRFMGMLYKKIEAN